MTDKAMFLISLVSRALLPTALFMCFPIAALLIWNLLLRRLTWRLRVPVEVAPDKETHKQ